MKLIIAFIVLAFVIPSGPTWLTDYNKAKIEASTKHKLVLVNFSGSDWCGPCIRTKKEIFNTESFQSFAEERLVLVQADFPRSKKNQLSKEQVQKNEALAEKYNKDGIFPLTLLLNSDGKILHKWEGIPASSPLAFVNEIRTIEQASK
ncbi:MAG TPA: thioredoxin family protein [Daejeonella sp.]|nr:thioredoxin family protein [Daejeonella sp.]